MTRPAPEFTNIPRCVTCQSDATPSLALYWHIGETTIRLASSSPASRIGENKALGMWLRFRQFCRSEGGNADHTVPALMRKAQPPRRRRKRKPARRGGPGGQRDRRRGIGGRERRSGG